MVAKKCWIPSKGTYSVGESIAPSAPIQGDLSYASSEPKDLRADAKAEEGHPVTFEELLKANKPLEDFLQLHWLISQRCERTRRRKMGPQEVVQSRSRSRYSL